MERGLSVVVVLLTILCLSVQAKEEVTLTDLSKMTDAQLAKFDIAELNLRCAESLPGAEKMDRKKLMKKLDQWAGWVSRETEKNLYRYHQAPEKFRSSEPFFRMAMMLTVVAQDFRCHYSPERGTDPANPEPADTFFANSQDLFINGFLEGTPTGTCASFPVLFTALGRRLGYPIKLVTTRAHLFCRWDDGKVKLNIEGTNGGLKCHPDEYYRNWPYKIDDVFIKENGHLQSQTPKGELAIFLSSRAYCLEANKKFSEAEAVAAMALHLMPNVGIYQRLHKHLSSKIESDQS